MVDNLIKPFVYFLALFLLLPIAGFAQVEREQEGGPLPSYAKKISLSPGRIGSLPKINVSRNNLPNIMLAGYWPPTNEMLRRFSTDPVQNPQGWIGDDWEGKGYNVYSFFPEFPSGVGKGIGDFEVDYQDTSADFWNITGQVNPIAIITFGRAYANNHWELEFKVRNLKKLSWYGDYLSPYKPTPAPPDTANPAGYIRYMSLPGDSIVTAVNSAMLGVSAYVDNNGFAGGFLCEFIGYHATWYHDLHCLPSAININRSSGHIHVGSNITLPTAIAATEVTLRALIEHLDKPLLANGAVLREKSGDSIFLDLDAGSANANREYLILGNMSGVFPGFSLPGGTVTFPLNWDGFTDLGLTLLNTQYFFDFMGTLDAAGRASASFNTYNPLPSGMLNLTLSFGYALPYKYPANWYASNPVSVRIVP